MAKATLRRNKRRMITLACRFDVGREELAKMVSHGLYWRPSFKSVQYVGEFVPHLGREGLCKWARQHVHECGVYVRWSEDAEQYGKSGVIRKRAYELVDRYFPELKN